MPSLYEVLEPISESNAFSAVVNDVDVPPIVVPELGKDIEPISVSCSFKASITVVAVNDPAKACVGSTLAFNTSISVSNSSIAGPTVEAVVPIADALIVPSSASCSLIADLKSGAVVVNV